MGISHRDIKPDNILVGEKDDDVKIIDFGVSKRFKHFVNENRRLDQKSRDMWTRTGNYLYCAPEIFLGGGYNEKIDIWSVGIILHQMLTGKLPFLSETIYDTIELISQYDNRLNFQSL
jgi:calcium-dependent protein kinase